MDAPAAWIGVALDAARGECYGNAMTGGSEAVTRGVKVAVEPRYSPDHSDPRRSEWFFLYHVTISNEGEQSVRLISRHWVITDATGEVQEVRGPGVVGEQPRLAPGQSFEYTSGCPLSTPFGSMHGSYQMVLSDGEQFDAEIGAFSLSMPASTN